jgi:hypothetical protein
MKEFNKELFKLGSLCIRSHNYDDEGHSLRYISNKTCVDCHIMTKKEKDNIDNKIKIELDNINEKYENWDYQI